MIIEQALHKRKAQIFNKLVERCSTPFLIKEIQVKSIIEWLRLKHQTILLSRKKVEIVIWCWWEYNLVQQLWKTIFDQLGILLTDLFSLCFKKKKQNHNYVIIFTLFYTVFQLQMNKVRNKWGFCLASWFCFCSLIGMFQS